jgi:phosphonate transport system permease protein
MTTPVSVRPVALTVHGGAFRYADGTVALSNVELEVQRGEHVAILGPSGGGKTTLLGIISGRLRLSAGSVSRQGKIATVHQDLRLVPQSTVLTNVLHGALSRRSWRGFSAIDRGKAKLLLKRVGLEEKAHTRVSRLSGGQKQRVAVARALMNDPDILLADEPVASLDARTAREVMGLLDRLRLSKGLTLVTVLHDRELARDFADRIVEVNNGATPTPPTPPTPATSTTAAAPATAMDRSGEATGTGRSGSGAAPGKPALLSPALVTTLVLLLAGLVWAAAGVHVSERQAQDLLPNLADFAGRLIPSWSQLLSAPWSNLLSSLLETFRMALLGTAIAAVLSLVLAALAAGNVAPVVVRVPARLLLNVLRAVPSIVWALLMVAALGLGTVAGIVALAAYSMGYLTKFYYEAFESAEPNTLDALRELGAGATGRLFFGVWPAARAAVANAAVFMLEYNVRAAGVLGIVGAGGIGYELKLHLDYGNFHIVGIILGILILLVVTLDSLSSSLRTRLQAP